MASEGESAEDAPPVEPTEFAISTPTKIPVDPVIQELEDDVKALKAEMENVKELVAHTAGRDNSHRTQRPGADIQTTVPRS